MGKKAVVGVKGRGETEGISPSFPPSVLKILSYLSRIMSLIDEPVKVRVKDGSMYSGKFFTASMEGHGIVLKDAELIVKGECKSNVAIGKAVKTLVVRPCHIVEVGSERKGITLSGDDLSTGLHGDAFGAEGTVPSSESLLPEAKETTKSVEDKMSKINTSQDEETLINALKDNCEFFLKSMEDQGSNPRSKTFPVEPIGEGTAEKKPFHSKGSKDASEVTPANTTPDVVGSSVSNSSASVTATSSELDPHGNSKSDKSSKAMLNSKAKNYSPSSSSSPSISMHVAGSQRRHGTGVYPPRPSPNRHQQNIHKDSYHISHPKKRILAQMGNRHGRGHYPQAAPQVPDPNPQAGVNAQMMPPTYYWQPVIQVQGPDGFVYTVPQGPPFDPRQGGQPVQCYMRPPHYGYPGEQPLPPLASQMLPPVHYVRNPSFPAPHMPTRP